MKIRSADYLISGVREEHYPTTGFPEVAFVGRSNVGKSSLINALLNRRNLARTSSQPGKTQTANFYVINEAFYLVDLPGYGYAKVSQTERVRYRKMIEQYLLKRQTLRLIVQVVDFRHAPTALDQEMYRFLGGLQTPKLVVANKTDKVKRSQLEVHTRSIRATLPGIQPDRLILFSAETKQGVSELWSQIRAHLSHGQVNE